MEPYPSAIRTWDCRDIEFLNLHNYAHARVKFTSNASLLDVNSGREARRWELARLRVDGNESPLHPRSLEPGKVEAVASGFEFIDGLAQDSRGNIYFCEFRMRRIYKLDAATGKVTFIADLPWNPVALAFDTQDNLLVVTKYIAQPGYRNDDTRDARRPLFGWRGSGGLWGFTYVPKVYAVRTDNADETFRALPLVDMEGLPAAPQAVCYLGNRTLSQNEYYGGRKPSQCFVAPDGVTIIPYYEDLFRCSSLQKGVPGQPIRLLDEYHQRVILSDLDSKGFLRNSRVWANDGDRGLATDARGNLYVTDGNITVYSPEGKPIRHIAVPERPTSVLVAGDMLYITAVSTLYSMKID